MDERVGYVSVRQAALKQGLRPGTVYNRMRNLGWSLERALTKPATSHAAQKVKEMAAQGKLAVPAQLVYQRIMTLGWEPEKAARTPRKDRSLSGQHEYNGGRYTVAELEAMSGIPRAIISHRVNSLGWSLERVLATPVRKRRMRQRYQVTHDGKKVELAPICPKCHSEVIAGVGHWRCISCDQVISIDQVVFVPQTREQIP